MHVRDAVPEDAPAIAEVARASWHAAYDDLLGAESVDDIVGRWYEPSALREELAEAGDHDDVVFLVAESDDAADGRDGVVGFANAGPASTPEEPAPAFVSRLYVLPDRWGNGIGSRLTESACRRLLEAGHEAVWLEVFERNEVGRSFYESVGFERVDAVEETFAGTTLTTLHLRARLADVVEHVGD